ncbi:RHS repeat-associated core domain-containing protein [Cellulomonas sp. HD19AZ1]|uniref:RHS repeat-associated core domain-containing protein n=1 Tax=Cellulomonas sp. HD19AZ1 TaxID=2559593 RepID=UPI001070730F|nr:RHS repeat-associated core domain-containing protein [Cellulomonas sp. HD19AZ1]TFH71287.1 RHS repeat protein [Cellulomonas sp. HD19AZ1]
MSHADLTSSEARDRDDGPGRVPRPSSIGVTWPERVKQPLAVHGTPLLCRYVAKARTRRAQGGGTGMSQRTSLTRALWSAVVVALVATMSATLVAAPAHADTQAWAGEVSLSVDRTDLHSGSRTVQLNVKTSIPLQKPYQLSVYDSSGVLVWACDASSSSTCRPSAGPVDSTFSRTIADYDGRSFTAYVAKDAPSMGVPVDDVRSTASTPVVTNVGWVGSVSLSVDRTDLHSGSRVVQLNVKTSIPLQRPYRLSVYDSSGVLVWACDASSSSTCRPSAGPVDSTFSRTIADYDGRSFTAYVAKDAPSMGVPVDDVRSTASTPVVTNIGWVGSVSLKVDRTALDSANREVLLEVETSIAIPSPYRVTIYDDAGKLVMNCGQDSDSTWWSNGCRPSATTPFKREVKVVVPDYTSRTFTAYVSKDAPGLGPSVDDVRASSTAPTVTNVGWVGSVSVDARRIDDYSDGYSLQLTVKATMPVVAPYRVVIYDNTGAIVKICGWDRESGWSSNACNPSTTRPMNESFGLRVNDKNPRSYVAYLARDYPSPGYPVDDVRAISGVYASSALGPTAPGEVSGGSNPSQSCSDRCHGDPVNSRTGEFWESVTDLAGAGPAPVGVTRTYAASRASTDGPLGHGWTWPADMRLAADDAEKAGTIEDAAFVSVTQENGSIVRFARLPDGSYVAPGRTLATLERASDETFRLTRRSGPSFIFDGAGRLRSVTDRNGNTVTYERDSSGRLVSASGTSGGSLTFAWSEQRVTEVTDHLGRAVVYGYSAAGDLTSVKGPDGSTTSYEYDSAHRVVALTSATGGTTRNTYDASGRVVKQMDPLGRELAFAYATGQTTVTDPSGMVTVEKYTDGQVVSVTKGAGTPLAATTTFTYGPTNQVESTTDPLGRVTRFTYDARGNRTSVTDPLGRTSTTTYDAFNNPLVVTNAAGEATTFTYDERGNPLSMTDPTGAATTFTVNPDGTVATATDPTGGVTTYTYDAHGFVASLTGPDGAVVTTVRDALGRVEASTDPRGAAPGSTVGEFTSTFTYDAAGRRLTSTDPLGAVVASAYDAAGRPTSVTDATGATTTTEYDAAGQVTAVVDAAGARTTFTYDGAGRVTSVTDAAGTVTETAYDVLGRATAVTDPLGRVTRTEYDAGDRVVATVSPSGARTAYAYDDADQLLTVTDPKGKVTTTTYDRAGRPVTVTDADGRKVTTSYDRAGRPVKVLRADGSALLWDYDPAGRVTATVDAAGERTTYTYDAAGRRASATDTAGRTTTFGYDPAGLLTSLTQPDGAVTTYDHDAAGRRTATEYSDGTPDESTVYDLAGRPTAVTDGSGTTTYAYDAVGRVTRVAQGSTEVGYAWDAVGRLTDLTYPSGERVRRAYDAAGQLTTVTDWADRVFTYAYDADGLTTEVAYPNGVTTDVDRDAVGLAVAMTTSANGVDLLELAYGYTDAGLLADQTTTRSTQSRAPPAAASTSSTFTWDGLARISEVEGHGAGVFAFDAAGSVTTLADGRTLTYDAARQLQSLTAPASSPGGDPSTTTYSYDARGNRLTATTGSGDDASSVEHVYDQANRLTSVTTADGTATSYTYGPGGLRATATTGTATEHYTWDTLAGVPLLLADAMFAYVYGTGSVPLAQVDLADGDVDYLHTDTLGSVRSTTDAIGAVTSGADYDPYGRPEAPTSDPTAQVTRFGYAGEYTDPTGYLYLRARYYDPESAQFLTRDPLEATTGNPYGYTDGNPLQHVDPLGLIDWGVAIGIGVATALVTGAVLCVASVACAAAVGIGGGLALAGGGVAAGATTSVATIATTSVAAGVSMTSASIMLQTAGESGSHASSSASGRDCSGASRDQSGGRGYQARGEAAKFDLDEIAEMVRSHTLDASNQRPGIDRILQALQKGRQTRLEGRTQLDLGNVRVIVNESQPWRSTTFYR